MKKLCIILTLCLLFACTAIAEEQTVSNVIKPDPSIELLTPTPEPTPEPTPIPKRVTIATNRKSVIEEGATVTLTSKLEGFEGCEVYYQWQRDKGNGFEDMPGATSATYSFAATAETLCWGWRLIVYYAE
ncbi:MAG: hypothetical protein IJS17_04555 [Clostridia bacterium]|nr:hypothetical protein [Clostridia bacterium]